MCGPMSYFVFSFNCIRVVAFERVQSSRLVCCTYHFNLHREKKEIMMEKVVETSPKKISSSECRQSVLYCTK